MLSSWCSTNRQLRLVLRVSPLVHPKKKTKLCREPRVSPTVQYTVLVTGLGDLAHRLRSQFWHWMKKLTNNDNASIIIQ
jgi:hypothetical protein